MAVIVLLIVPMVLGAWPPRVEAAGERVYLALGDSIAAGHVTSLPRVRGYPALVRQSLERLPVAAGSTPGAILRDLAVPGETAVTFIEGGQFTRFQQELEAIQARQESLAALTVSLGGNDVLRLSDADQAERQAGLERFRTSFPAALAAIKQALGSLTPSVVVTTYYDLSEGDPQEAASDAWWLAQFNEVIREAAEEQAFQVADLEATFRGHIDEWTWHPVDVHPNNAGHAEIARLVWGALGLDQQTPEVRIERPESGLVDRRTPTIRVSAVDNVGITSVDLWVDDEWLTSLLYLPDQNAYVGLWDARRFPRDRARLSVRAGDLAGNVGVAGVEVTLPSRRGGS